MILTVMQQHMLVNQQKVKKEHRLIQEPKQRRYFCVGCWKDCRNEYALSESLCHLSRSTGLSACLDYADNVPCYPLKFSPSL